MNPINLPPSPGAPLPSLTPTLTGAPSAPTKSPFPELTPDLNQVKTPLQHALDLGPLPWDPPAGKAPAPEAAFTERPQFKQLSQEDQATLEAFFKAGSDGADAKAAGRMAKQIGQLLQQGKLSERDAFGKDVMDHLEAFNQASLNGDVQKLANKGQIARDLVRALANPASLGQGKNTANCAEATLESTLAYSQPADYARIAVELATTGTASIPGPPQGPHPDKVELNLMGDAAGRSPLSFMMQRSFKASVDERSGIWLTIKNFFGVQDTDKGLNANEVKMLYDGIIGRDHVTVYADPGVDLLPAIEQVLERTTTNAIKATLKAESGLHAVAITSVSEEGVTIWDPATSKTDVLPKDLFNQLLVRATFDRDAMLKPTGKPEVKEAQNFVRQSEASGGSAALGAQAQLEEGGGRLGGGGRQG